MRTHKPKILLVDDETMITKSLIAQLRRLTDWDLASAANGSQACLLVQSFRPDAILMDLNMPVMGGKEACRRLKANSATAHIPIIIISGSGEELDDPELQLLIAASFLKPCRATQILEALAKLLGQNSPSPFPSPPPPGLTGADLAGLVRTAVASCVKAAVNSAVKTGDSDSLPPALHRDHFAVALKFSTPNDPTSSSLSGTKPLQIALH